MDKRMNYYGAPALSVDKSGLYPQSGYPGSGYPPSQPGIMQGLPQAQPSSAPGAPHRYPATLGQQYAGNPMTANPMTANPAMPGYGTLSGYSTGPAISGPAYASPTLGSSGAFHPAPNPAALPYATIQSIPATTLGYSQYPTGAPTYIGGSQVPSAGYPPQNQMITVASPLHHPGAGGFTGASIASMPRGYTAGGTQSMPGVGVSPVAYPSSLAPGSNPSYAPANPYGGAPYSGF